LDIYWNILTMQGPLNVKYISLRFNLHILK
jgi:hypothetical protein